ncbi:DoxX family protein [Flavobacterium cyanobacteriorum]|uniref:DoxX family protein n=1 Tax=Flavobacterium cyanobacteriorum TaxID=2022802 RepID=A0A255Z9K8_9FLAO|nr:DoxX family protein [Flavobacterium cyanobacteriorum]OYQ38139.1 DoxX family protein [Flavobacterium cyanobacteriorum]
MLLNDHLLPAIIMILAFLAITFIQSGYDKVTEWNGNVEWLKGHFAQTFLKNQVPAALFLILALEVVSGAFAVIGIIELLVNGGIQFAQWAALLSCITLLSLLLGQRIAKDYDGARTIVIYFIPAVLLLSWLN